MLAHRALRIGAEQSSRSDHDLSMRNFDWQTPANRSLRIQIHTISTMPRHISEPHVHCDPLEKHGAQRSYATRAAAFQNPDANVQI